MLLTFFLKLHCAIMEELKVLLKAPLPHWPLCTTKTMIWFFLWSGVQDSWPTMWAKSHGIGYHQIVTSALKAALLAAVVTYLLPVFCFLKRDLALSKSSPRENFFRSSYALLSRLQLQMTSFKSPMYPLSGWRGSAQLIGDWYEELGEDFDDLSEVIQMSLCDLKKVTSAGLSDWSTYYWILWFRFLSDLGALLGVLVELTILPLLLLSTLIIKLVQNISQTGSLSRICIRSGVLYTRLLEILRGDSRSVELRFSEEILDDINARI